MTISKSAKAYQERRIPEDRNTMRGPAPWVNLSANGATKFQLVRPLPLPELLHPANGAPPPDAGHINKPWPPQDDWET